MVLIAVSAWKATQKIVCVSAFFVSIDSELLFSKISNLRIKQKLKECERVSPCLWSGTTNTFCNLPAPPQTGAAGCRVAWWGVAWLPASMSARRWERRCPPAWRLVGKGRTGWYPPSLVFSGRLSSPGPASSPSGWNSALQGRRQWLTQFTSAILYFNVEQSISCLMSHLNVISYLYRTILTQNIELLMRSKIMFY